MNPASSYPDPCNVVWTDPGRDSSASMPLGNGDIGLNVWVEEGGDLLFYIGKTDAWSGQNQLLKPGRVRLCLTPNPYRQGLPFRQTLRLRQGDIEIQAGEPESPILTRIRADANLPAIFLEVEARQPVEARVSLEMWRDTASLAEADLKADPPAPEDAVVLGKDRILWFHRNRTSIYPASMRLQGLESLLSRLPDPLINRTFGGMMRGKGFIGDTPYSLKSDRPRKRLTLAIHLLTSQADTAEEWADRLEKQAKRVESVSPAKARNAHNRWWGDFWKRSRIEVSGPEPEIEALNRGYALQRFISACAGRGAYPIKFNGSLFTVDAREPNETGDADYRRWGGCYWFQNTRLAYWPMMASGDFDLMPPFFDMYRAMLPLALERTRLYFGHTGAFFPETLTFWGLYADDNYGVSREGKPASHVDNTYIRHYHSGALELLSIMLGYYAHTGNAEFIRESLLPVADGVLDFYDKHYPRDARGKLLFKPAQSLETWQEAVNPLPEIAGLKWVLDGLLALSPAQTGADRRSAWKRLLSELPPLPLARENGQSFLKAASEILAPAMNSENPELYAVFPYRLYGVGKPDIATAVETFRRRIYQGNEGWRQDPIQAALLGLAEPARRMVLQRFSNKHPGSRFPAFWGPNADWIPDQDHGTVGLMALQTMLLQAEGHKILLFPAWPEDWDVSFRLHAPYKTTVEGVYRQGKLESLKVTPASRRKGVVLGSEIETEKPL